jgi:uncharacterized membrane protein YbhN (UPF0104 family)
MVRAAVRTVMPVALTFAAFAIISVVVGVEPVIAALKTARPEYLAALTLVAAFLVVITVPRMQLILAQLGAPPIGAGFLLQLNFFTAVVGYMVPFGVLADGARAVGEVCGLGEDRIAAVVRELEDMAGDQPVDTPNAYFKGPF